MKQTVRLSTLCLVIVGTVDMLMTILWLKNGGREGNALFSALAHLSLYVFIAGKLLFLFGPIAILEYARRAHPRSAEQGTWLATMLYLVLLTLHIRANFVG